MSRFRAAAHCTRIARPRETCYPLAIVRTMWLYLGIYFTGLALGVAANVLLDVRLHRPALGRQITLAALGVLLAVIIYQYTTATQEWIMYGLWAATGVLAGLGSRATQEPLE